MADQYADILGAETLPIGPKRAGSWSGLSFPVKFALILGFSLVFYIVLVRLWDLFWRWREKEYKLSMRRKYGIPDNDHRPFNVAYAAAQLAREEQDKKKARRRHVEQPASASSSLEQRNALPEQVRHRPVAQHASSSRSSAMLPGQYNPMSMDSIPSVPSTTYSHLSPNSNRVTFADGYNTSASPLDTHTELTPLSPAVSSSSRRISDRKSLGILKSSNNINYINDDRRKRAFGGEEYDHSGDEEIGPKKTRVEGDELIDGGEEPEWENAYPNGRMSISRGPKRGYEDDARQRGKRQRKVSNEDIGMDVDEERDDVGELIHLQSSRGKKRDRAEAGSSFGGDDDENIEQDVEDYGQKSRHRKRRNKRRSDANSSLRGRKRDRDLEEENGDSSDTTDDSLGTSSRRSSKKKRGKKSQRGEEEKGSDVSMDDSQPVRSAVKGRKIGEEWTSNGVTYKIGPNGQRLRETLLKKAKQRFIMPEDSVHPDRSAVHDVYVEAWLTDEEYQTAAAQGILYQSSRDSQTTSPAETPASTPPPTKGKHLLWESTTAHPSTPQPANPFETSPRKVLGTNGVATNGRLITASGQSASPFPKNGRIASSFRSSVTVDTNSAPPSPGLADSTNSLNSPRLGRYRQYSKWEKQDLEAKAMMRMREANNKKKEEEERLEKERKEKEARAREPALTVPTISLTKPPEDQAKEKEAPKSTFPSFSLVGATSSAIAAPKSSFGTTPTPASNTDDKAKTAAPASSTSTPSFSLSSAPSSAPAAPTSSPTKSPFSFGPPAPPTTISAPTPAPVTAALTPSLSFSFPKPPSAAPVSTPSEAAKPSIGLGFPSSAPSQPSSTTTTTNTSTTTPKFSFGIPPKPGTNAGAEQNKDSAGDSSLLSRMSPADSSSKPQVQPLQSSGTTAPTGVTTASVFSFAKPTPAPAATSASSSNVDQAQKQEVAAAPAPLKFSFAKPTAAPGPSTSTPASTTPAPAPSSSATEPKPQGAFAFKPAESTATTAAAPTTGTSPLKFGFAAPAATASSTGTDAPRPAFGPFGGNTSNGNAFVGNTSVASAFGAPSTPAASSTGAAPIFGAFGGANTFKDREEGNAKPATNEQPKSAFGGGGFSTPSPFGVTAASGSNIFGSKPPATDISSKETSTAAQPPSIFGGASGTSSGAFGFGSKPQDSSAKPAFGGGAFGGGTTTPGASTSTPSGFSGFGGSTTSTGASSIFGAKPADSERPKLSFGAAPAASNGSLTSGGNEAPKSTFSFGSSSTTPAAETKPFSFGTPSSTSSAPAAGGSFSFGSGAQPSPFGGATFGSTAFGSNTNNAATGNGATSAFSFSRTNTADSQQSK
ncbi:hypothetical protein WG66_011498 [Moniliophthora roreri]|nr:hypothetical protein WG66_011498 [Moniliophthora roreri]